MAPWTLSRLSLLPALHGIVMAMSVAIPYAIAVSRGDVSVYMPFISESGGKPPESGIFSLLLITGIVLGILTMFLRYFIVIEMVNCTNKKITLVNAISLVVGMISIVGMAVVASYPVYSIRPAHDAGAYTLFLLGVLYSVLQTYITFKMHPTFNGIFICYLRFLISTLSSLVILLLVIFNPLALSKWKSANNGHHKEYKVPGDIGFNLLVISSSAEWMLAILFIAFFFTYIREFQKVHMKITTVPLVNHFDDPLDIRNVLDPENQPLF